ncbi:Laminin subunit alpha [Halotydeus destructor]|nr:Laminin subunit alpha [Halotydeus destructor]
MRLRTSPLSGLASSSCLLLAFLTTALIAVVNGQKFYALNPPTFNLAEGKKILATATCGDPQPEMYCKLVGANWHDNIRNDIVDGQACATCDMNNASLRHDAKFAIDGTERWWQSPPLSRGRNYSEVTVTIDLGQEFHVAYVLVKMGNSPRPGVWILERSVDNGQTYTPWQYFAASREECQQTFPMAELTITRDDSVICEYGFSDILPLENGEVAVRLLKDRPSSETFENSPVLQQFTKATNVSLRLLKPRTTLGHLMSVERQDPTVTRRYFYSIKDINIGGRCVCNGHASSCADYSPDSQKLVCRCDHNTVGDQCQLCKPGYHQKKWMAATNMDKNICEKCNCYGHSEECYYDEDVESKGLSVNMNGQKVGGGVCLNCQHNTEGINCEKCRPTFYRPFNRPLNSSNVCVPCRCNLAFSTGNCDEGTGRCHCRENFEEPNCDRCSYGYTEYPLCRPCDCFPNGTQGQVCELRTGDCPCLDAFAGRDCRQCAEGFFGFPKCDACDCDGDGTVSGTTCNVTSGQCMCKSGYGGRRCDQCDVGYFNFPQCQQCSCSLPGCTGEVCNQDSGECLCKSGFDGERCQRCQEGFFGFPNCTECACSEAGSSDPVCNEVSGKCKCKPNYYGPKCTNCAVGHFRYPECLPCNCHPIGNQGMYCNPISGACDCRSNFAGDKCTECKEGYYIFPRCEPCDCNQAGVVVQFEGCNSTHLAAGELCKCKDHVTGRQCGQCKEGYWNLESRNPQGCQDCLCSRNGTISSVVECNGRIGQCKCKANIRGRTCDICTDGNYGLQDGHLFGCTDCDCDIGGAISNLCDKTTGRCPCRARIDGRRCDKPKKGHFFPTLHQFKYEVEDGKSASGSNARFGYDEEMIPNYSWKGYAIFSHLQREVNLNITINRPGFFKTIFRFMTVEGSPANANLTMMAKTHYAKDQSVQFILPPSEEPLLSLPKNRNDMTPNLYLDVGKYLARLTVDKNTFIDYLVFVPDDYYEANLLKENVAQPCLDIQPSGTLCRHYDFPKLSADLPTARGENGKSNQEQLATMTYDKTGPQKTIFQGTAAKLTPEQSQILIDMDIPETRPYVLIVLYHNPSENEDDVNIHDMVKASVATTAPNVQGEVSLDHCPYSFMCRQVVTKEDGRIRVFDFEEGTVGVSLAALSLPEDSSLSLDSIVALPYDQWSLDYVTPEFVCVLKESYCIESLYPPPRSEVTKIEFEREGTGSLPKLEVDTLLLKMPSVVELNENNLVSDIRGKVPRPGYYKIILHYHQLYHPVFDLDVAIQEESGKLYSAIAPVPFCPSLSGCRTILKQRENNFTLFDINKGFVATLRLPKDKSVYLDYVMFVGSQDFEEDEYLKLEPQPKVLEFVKDCVQNSFLIGEEESEFCKKSVFSLTTAYNGQALECKCHHRGSTSNECNAFGGQCPCKPNVIGRTCTACKMGFYGFPDCKPCNCPATAYCEPRTGKCICPPRVTGDNCTECMPLTFGYDPINGCQECQCNFQGVESRRDEFGRWRPNLACDRENGQCDCKTNVVERTCDRCRQGFWSFPECKFCECDPRGVIDHLGICNQQDSTCFCKANVRGRYCDDCVSDAYSLEDANPDGCTKCFCFGNSDSCRESQFFVTGMQNMTSIQGWNLHFIETSERGVRMLPVPVEEAEVEMMGENRFNVISTILEGRNFYISLPESYVGKQLGSYGGFLKYSIVNIVVTEEWKTKPQAIDVILVGNDRTIAYDFVEQTVEANSPLKFEIELVERNFRNPVNRDQITRDQFMMVLVKLEGIFIRLSYIEAVTEFQIADVMMDTTSVQPVADGAIAKRVEKCTCPPNYKGPSCEECNDGYYRVNHGPYLGYCVKCDCNRHSDQCDPTTGLCFDCQHNTLGDHCELCAEGYYGNSTKGTPDACMICPCPLPDPSNNFATSCDVSPDGRMARCKCKPGYVEPRCDICDAGYFGRPLELGSNCSKCQCNGNIDPTRLGACDSVTGECLECLNNTTGRACELCAPWYHGDAITAKDCKPCDCDQTGTQMCDPYTGKCICKPNVDGERCDTCKPDNFGFYTGRGCTSCNCKNASLDSQCDDSGQCPCKPGAAGLQCETCEPGFWKYSNEGCESCNCGTKFSYGAVCNQETGKCQCLPGVMGDKCDSCPFRWVFEERKGCRQCDQCTDFLLDDTDALAAMIDPYQEELREANASVFGNRRLAHLTTTLETVGPLIESINENPFKEQVQGRKDTLDAFEGDISTIDNLADKAEARSKQIAEDAHGHSRDAMFVKDSVKEKYKDIIKLVEDLRRLEMALGQSFLSQNIEGKLEQANDILKFLEERDITKINDAAGELDDAKRVMQLVKEFAAPTESIVDGLNAVKTRIEHLQDILDQLYKMSVDSSSKVAQFQQDDALNRGNQEDVKASVALLKDSEDNANEQVSKSQEHVDKANKLLAEFQAQIEDIQLSVPKLQAAKTKLEDYMAANPVDQESLWPKIGEMKLQGAKLEAQARELDDTFSSTRDNDQLQKAMSAASSYQTIVDAINNASVSGDEANNAAVTIEDNINTIQVNMKDAKEISYKLKREAEGVDKRITDELVEDLKMRKEENERISEEQLTHKTQLTEINRELDSYQSKNLIATIDAVNPVSDSVKLDADEVLARIDPLLAEIDEKNKTAHDMKGESIDTYLDLTSMGSDMQKIEDFNGKIKDKLEKTERLSKEHEAVQEEMKLRLEEVRKRVEQARGLANRIELGVQFDDNTVLELRNPDSLYTSGTYTKFSMSFKADSPDGLLAYIGNPIGVVENRKRRQAENELDIDGPERTFYTSGDPDFLAVELKASRVVLTMNLGQQADRLENELIIQRNVWHDLLVERVGKTMILTVTREGIQERSEGLLGGSNNVFDLTPDRSKIYIGGIPKTVVVQREVENTRMNGVVANVVYGDTPIGLYNFVEGEYLSEGSAIPEAEATPNGLRFDGNSYVILSKGTQSFERETYVKLSFKTYAREGLLFLVGDERKYFSIYLRQSRLYVVYELGSGYQTLVSPENKKYNDGKWHVVDVARLGKECQLVIDGVVVANDGVGMNTALGTDDNIYIGGYPGGHPYSDEEVTNVGFEGCIKEVELGSVRQDLANTKEASSKIVKGCPETVSREASFTNDTTGFVEMPLEVNLDQLATVTLKYRTDMADGLLFFAANAEKTSFISIYLHRGNVILRTDPGRDKIETKAKYYGDKWHYVSAHKDEYKMRLEVDDNADDVVNYISPNPLAIRGLEEPLSMYFGGVPEDLTELLVSNDIPVTFEGCLGDLTVNEQLQNFANSPNRPGASLASCPFITPLSTQTTTLAPEILPSVAPEATTVEEDEDEKETEEETEDDNDEVTTSVAITSTETPSTPETNPFGCKLPLTPAQDDTVTYADGVRFGALRHTRHEFKASSSVTTGLMDESTFGLEFKTKGDEGVLFYVGDAKYIDFVALTLREGRLIFSYNNGGGVGMVMTDKVYNDGEWHRVVFSRRKRVGEIKVDEGDENRGLSPGEATSLNVKSPVYIGGLSEEAANGAKNSLQQVTNSFPGCIRKVYIQGILVKLSAETRGVDNAQQCSDKIEDGVFFSFNPLPSNPSYVSLAKRFKVGRTLQIDIDIKPRSPDGVILAVFGDKDYLVLQMVEGILYFSADNGAGIIEANIDPKDKNYFCDGEWHHINAAKDANVIIVNVDNVFFQSGIGQGGVSSTDTNSPLYIGGVPSEYQNKGLGLKTDANYVGCVRNLEKSNRPIGFADAVVYGDINLSSCPTI